MFSRRGSARSGGPDPVAQLFVTCVVAENECGLLPPQALGQCRADSKIWGGAKRVIGGPNRESRGPSRARIQGKPHIWRGRIAPPPCGRDGSSGNPMSRNLGRAHPTLGTQRRGCRVQIPCGDEAPAARRPLESEPSSSHQVGPGGVCRGEEQFNDPRWRPRQTAGRPLAVPDLQSHLPLSERTGGNRDCGVSDGNRGDIARGARATRQRPHRQRTHFK